MAGQKMCVGIGDLPEDALVQVADELFLFLDDEESGPVGQYPLRFGPLG
jgi:hypothetical protein